MKASYNWLKDYCKHELPLKALSEGLTNVGFVVDNSNSVDDDFCLEIEVTSNRPDCLGMIGIAREIATFTRGELIIPDVDYGTINEDVNDITGVVIEDRVLCPRYTARIIKDVNIGPSPEWLQRRITAIGLRPVNNIVDITNYVLMESGQPLHAFDLDKLKGKKIIVRRAVNGETMMAIDGTKCALTQNELVIADSERPVAIAGIMGGKDTEVTETTKNILLESAFFEPGNVRRSSRKLSIQSDSSFRFERGVDPECVDWASGRAAKMIREMAGGQIAQGVIDINCLKKEKTNVTLRVSRLNNLLGIDLEKDVMKEILERLRFETVSEAETSLEVSVPSFRGDVYREIDLIEEVARIHGYDKIPAKSSFGVKLNRENKFDIIVEKVKNIISGLGFNEVITDSIVDNSQEQHAGIWSASSGIRIMNPIRQDEDILRKTMILNLLKVKKHNQNHGIEKTHIYELSKLYLPQKTGGMPDEKECLCILGEEDFLSLKGVIETILYHLNIKEGLESLPYSFGLFDPGESAKLKLGEEILGYIGKVNDDTIKRYDFRSTPYITELDFKLLVEKANLRNSFQKLPAFPAIIRDLAIVCAKDITWGSIKGCIESLKIEYLDNIKFFDVFSGEQIEEGKKSIAFSLTFRADDRTLKSEEVDVLQKKILEKLENTLGARLRT